MSTKKIVIKFDPDHPDRAIAQAKTAMIRYARERINNYKKTIEEAADILGQQIAEQGVSIAASLTAAMAAYDSGELMSSFKGTYDKDARRGEVFTDCNHAKFVEFGTGVVGAESPYENPNISTVYDINNHGEAGWVYKKNDRLFWTQGQPSRPFMWQTAQDLRVEIPNYVEEIINRVKTK